MTGSDRAATLCRWALEEGFDRAGVARLEEARTAPAYRRWIERRQHASMAYLERRGEVRADPRRLLPGGRSALCVALQYHPLGGEAEAGGDLWPRVARYARGTDYHRLMEAGLRRLGQKIEEAYPGARARGWVDTGPILERELAAAAGLGVFGKNTNLLHPEGGSWFLLGELLTTLDLAPSDPLGDLCGSCTQCLEACPTGALPEPYRLDANLCISYWTIEHRGTIPPSIRPLLEDWVFGCDVCQEVCPVNAEGSPADHPELRLPRRRRALDLSGLLGLPTDDYVEIFRHSAMKRAKRDGLRRNAAIAMGNRGRQRYVAPLVHALDDDDPTVRAHAAWALGRIGGSAARTALRAALETESDAIVRGELEAALSGS